MTTMTDRHKEVSFGMCFDCDGVLARGTIPIPAAVKGFNWIHDSEGQLKVPVCFVTNAVNRDCDKAATVSKWLDIQVTSEQMVEAQSPLEVFEHFHDMHVLVIGQGKLHDIARDIGFKDISTIEEIAEAYPLLDVVNHQNRIRNANRPVKEKEIAPVEAILLMGEPVDWGRDLQLIIDLLMTNGRPSVRLEHTPKVTIPVIACSADLLFMDRAPLPRFGHGAFLACLEKLYKKITGNKLEYTCITGKPSEITFHYAEHCLTREAQRIGIKGPIKRLYFIGDCPDSDIVGAHLYHEYIQRLNRRRSQSPDGKPVSEMVDPALPMSRNMPPAASIEHQTVEEVHSILVCTGVYKQGDDHYTEGHEANNHAHRDFPHRPELYQPHTVCQDVQEAIQFILDKEGVSFK